MSRFFNRFTAFDFIVMALMAAIGVATKPFITALAHIITGPLMIPGGSVAGGFYMLFLVLGAAIVGKRGAALLIALVEALLVVVTGMLGSHGLVSFITYLLPGLGVELLWLLIRHNGCCVVCCFLGGVIANLLGCFSVNLVFFRLPAVPLVIMLCTAALSGGLGGILAWNINKLLLKGSVIRRAPKAKQALKEAANEEAN